MGLFSRKNSGGNNAEVASSLASEKQKSDIIVNSIDDAVIMVDDSNVVHVFNPGAAKLSGWTAAEAENLDYRSLLKFVDEKNQLKGDELNPFYMVLGSGKPYRDGSAILQKKDSST